MKFSQMAKGAVKNDYHFFTALFVMKFGIHEEEEGELFLVYFF